MSNKPDKKFVIFNRGPEPDDEIAFGPFDSIEGAQRNLDAMGFKRIGTLWLTENNRATICELLPP